MSSTRMQALVIIVLIQMVSLISWSATQEKPMIKPMSFILNNVLNADLQSSNQLENEAVPMKNYQLFVYVGANCQACQIYTTELQKLALEKAKHLNVVVVYDHSSKASLNQKDYFNQSSTYEYFDHAGYMYHYLFNKPQYLSYVFTGPKHTIISDGQLSKLEDIETLKSAIN